MYARRPVSRCARCHALVPLEARFCSECGTWVVHASNGPITMPPAALAQGISAMNATVNAPMSAPPPADLGLLATAFAPPVSAPTPRSPQPLQPPPAAVAPARSVTAAPLKGTEVRTVDPSIGPTLPAAGAVAMASRPASVLPFGNVLLTPIASVPAAPSVPMVPMAHEPPSGSPPPPPAQAHSRGAAMPTFDGLPPLPSKQAPHALDVQPEPSAPSRAAPTIVGEAAKAPPPLSIARTPRPLGGFLVSFQYEPLGAFWPLAIGDNRIGRAGARPDVDVAIADATVSSDQAILTVERGAASIEDRGSTNRTFVNGRPLVAGARAPVRHGDRIRLGSYDAIMVLLPL